ncbi:MAG: DUF4105 domain-containing protein [Prevotella sp.]|nr:DUF4105 domain-containing protein [Prevotella sp.]
MIRLAVLKFLCLIAFVPVLAQNEPSVQAEPLIEDSANFVRAWLMVAEPSHLFPQTAFGHAFLRMQSPPNNLDYCFSMESGKFEGFFDICLGHYPNRLIPTPSAEYLRQFSVEGRIVTAYPLNISLEEGQHLWQLLDETAVAGDSPYHDFFHHGCSHEIVDLLERGLGGRIVFGPAARQYDGTLFSLGDRLMAANHPIRMAPFMLMTTDGSDRPLTDMDKTTFPTILPDILGDATVEKADGTRHAIFKPSAAPEVISPPQRAVSTAWPLGAWLGLLLAVTVVVCGVALLVRRRWSERCAHVWCVVLFVLYCLLTLIIHFFCLLSSLPTIHGWNWNLLIYNLIPIAVWIVGRLRHFTLRQWRTVYLGYGVWLCLFMAVMALWGGHQIAEQHLLTATFAVGCLYRAVTPADDSSPGKKKKRA